MAGILCKSAGQPGKHCSCAYCNTRYIRTTSVRLFINMVWDSDLPAPVVTCTARPGLGAGNYHFTPSYTGNVGNDQECSHRSGRCRSVSIRMSASVQACSSAMSMQARTNAASSNATRSAPGLKTRGASSTSTPIPPAGGVIRPTVIVTATTGWRPVG